MLVIKKFIRYLNIGFTYFFLSIFFAQAIGKPWIENAQAIILPPNVSGYRDDRYSHPTDSGPYRDFSREAVVIGKGVGQHDSPGKKTLSDFLKKNKPEIWLPESGVIDKFVKDEFKKDPATKITKNNTWLNGFLIFFSSGFFVAVVGLFVRFIYHVKIPELKAAAHNSEHARVFTDIIGYFLIPFFVTLFTASFGLDNVRLGSRQPKEDLKNFKPEYEKFQKRIFTELYKHKTFFALVELYDKLEERLYPTSNYQEYAASQDKLWQLVAQLQQIDARLIFADPLDIKLIRKKVRETLTNDFFQDILQEILLDVDVELTAKEHTPAFQGKALHDRVCQSLLSSEESVDKLLKSVCHVAKNQMDSHCLNLVHMQKPVIKDLPLHVRKGINHYWAHLEKLEEEELKPKPLYYPDLPRFAQKLSNYLVRHHLDLITQGEDEVQEEEASPATGRADGSAAAAQSSQPAQQQTQAYYAAPAALGTTGYDQGRAFTSTSVAIQQPLHVTQSAYRSTAAHPVYYEQAFVPDQPWSPPALRHILSQPELDTFQP